MAGKHHAAGHVGADARQQIGLAAVVALHPPVGDIMLVEQRLDEGDQLQVGVPRHGGEAHQAVEHIGGGHGALLAYRGEVEELKQTTMGIGRSQVGQGGCVIVQGYPVDWHTSLSDIINMLTM